MIGEDENLDPNHAMKILDRIPNTFSKYNFLF
jgi:hypothetical protein